MHLFLPIKKKLGWLGDIGKEKGWLSGNHPFVLEGEWMGRF